MVRRPLAATLPTQVVFEYLRLRFGKQVDGLVFPSVQTGEQGTNLVLFPEASVISHKMFKKPSEMEVAFGEDSDNPFASTPLPARLAVVNGSLRFHKVKAIVTKSDTYKSIHELYMSDEVRKQFGPTT